MTPTDSQRQFLGYRQQHWTRDGKDAGGYSALFAGYRARLQCDSDGAWIVMYLGFCSAPFASLKAAQQGAPAFAREVLADMASRIVDMSTSSP